MAKKPTLKSLLGSSDERQQVDLNLGQVALQNQMRTAGGYNVYARATPKTDALLQLAQNIKMGAQVFGQAQNIASNQAREDVAGLSGQELEAQLANNDKETLSIFGYDRAFQRGLVQRYISTNEEVIKNRFLNKANDPEMLMLDSDEFLQAMNEERDSFIGELREEFGGNAHREEALSLLGGVMTDGLIGETSKQFIKNKEHQAVAMESAKFSDNVSKIGFTKSLTQFRTELQGLGFLAPKEIKEKMHSAVSARNEVLIANSDYETARAEIEEAKEFKLYKGATLGGSAEDKAKFAELTAAVNKAEEDEDKKFPENSRGVRRALDVALNGISTPEISLDVFKDDLGKAFMRAGMSQVDIDPILDEIEEKPNIQEFIGIVAQASRTTENELTFNLLSAQLYQLKQQKREHYSGGAHTIGTFDEADMPALKASIRETLTLNPKTPLSQLPDIAGGRSMSRDDPMYINAVKEVLEGFNWERVPSQKDELISNAMTNITSKKSVPIFGEYAGEYAGRVQSDLNEIAPSLWDESDNNINIYNAKLQIEVNNLYKEYGERATARRNAQALIDQNALGAKTRIKVGKEAKRRAVRDFPSFKEAAAPSADDIISDRETIDTLDLDDPEKKRLKQASLMRWGFWSRESLDLNLMSDLGLGFRDVPLSASLLRDASLAQRVYEAIETGEELEPYTTGDGETYTVKMLKESAEYWKTLGFDSLTDFNQLEIAQSRIRNFNR